MSSLPRVTAVCLTSDRQAMTDRAVKCFLAQTYSNKSLLILDNGAEPYKSNPAGWPAGFRLVREHFTEKTIGQLRNVANTMAKKTDIIAHWDSDDWSHPLRLAWQVQRLRGNEDRRTDHPLECVGYKTLLFWRTGKSESKSQEHPPDCNCGTCGPGERTVLYTQPLPGEAWLFTHERPSYCVGTSLCYWRQAWESNPFRELYPPPGIGEDMLFLNGVKSEGAEGFFHDEPAMIAEIHGGNSTTQTIPGDSWKRVPEWDERLKELMRL